MQANVSYSVTSLGLPIKNYKPVCGGWLPVLELEAVMKDNSHSTGTMVAQHKA